MVGLAVELERLVVIVERRVCQCRRCLARTG